MVNPVINQKSRCDDKSWFGVTAGGLALLRLYMMMIYGH